MGGELRQRRIAGMPARLGWLLAAGIILGLDLWTKALVVGSMELGSVREVIPGLFNLVHRRNNGIAFSLFADAGPLVQDWLLPGFTLLAIVLVLFLFWREQGGRWTQPALALVLAGAAGNLIDRLRDGYVTDFVEVYLGDYAWPAFNVADSAITVGAALLLLEAFFEPKRKAVTEAESAPSNS